MTFTKSAEVISPLRRRMIEDMSIRKFSDKTRHAYFRHIDTFAKFLGRSPDTATAEDLRRYQVHQRKGTFFSLRVRWQPYASFSRSRSDVPTSRNVPTRNDYTKPVGGAMSGVFPLSARLAGGPATG